MRKHIRLLALALVPLMVVACQKPNTSSEVSRVAVVALHQASHLPLLAAVFLLAVKYLLVVLLVPQVLCHM